MFRITGILILLTLLNGCGPDAIDDGTFFYNESTGKCETITGLFGYNPVDLAWIRETKNCECVKFSKIEVLDLAGDTIAIPQRFGYYELTGYNFRGAVLDSCRLYFNEIHKSDLRGADLSTLQLGYAFVNGRIDEFTKPPIEAFVTIEGDSISCYN